MAAHYCVSSLWWTQNAIMTLCSCNAVFIYNYISIFFSLLLDFHFYAAAFLTGQMVVAKVLSRLYADMMLYGQSIVYYEHCVSVSRELKDKRLEGEYLEILSSLYLSLNTER